LTIRRRSPLRRSTKPIARNVPPNKRRKGVRRGPPGIPADEWRNKEYLQFLRDEGRCVPCDKAMESIGGPPLGIGWPAHPGVCEPMHGPPNGRSQKGPDAGAIPGCRPHHEEQTRIGWPAFEQKYGFDRKHEAGSWFAAFRIWQEHRK